MKKIFTLIVMLAATLGMQAQDTWTVTGVPALCGESWDPTIEANDMTTADGKNYTWTKQNVAMKAGTAYGFKVVKNHSWDNQAFGGAAGGQESDNYEIKVDENGAYTVTITFVFDEENSTISHEAVRTGDAEFEETTYTVAGVAVLCGVEWNPEATDNDMVSTDGGVTYTWTKQNVPLEGGVGYGFKICEDHAWTTAYGDDEGGNYMLTVNEDGEYTVVITFTVETKTISVETTKTADHDFGEKTWTIAGVAALMGSDWDPSDTNNDMTKVEDGIYMLVKNNVSLLGATEYTFKVLSNHSWTENYGADGVAGGDNVVLMVDEDGNYDVTFVFMVESKIVTADAQISAGIKNVKGENAGKAAIYNLQGQRVAAGFRGVAIQNGKKVVMK